MCHVKSVYSIKIKRSFANFDSSDFVDFRDTLFVKMNLSSVKII